MIGEFVVRVSGMRLLPAIKGRLGVSFMPQAERGQAPWREEAVESPASQRM